MLRQQGRQEGRQQGRREARVRPPAGTLPGAAAKDLAKGLVGGGLLGGWVPARRSGVALLLAVGVWVGAVLVSGGLLVGCSGKSRRLGEGEAYHYKWGLIQSNKTEISPLQAEKLMYYSGRTEGEIDTYLEKLKEEFELEKRAAEIDMDLRRDGGEEASESPSGGVSLRGGATLPTSADLRFASRGFGSVSPRGSVARRSLGSLGAGT